MDKKGNLFLAMDGDDMGHTVEDVLLENDTEMAQQLSASIHHAFETIEAFVKEHGGDVIFRGGDNILFSAPDQEAEVIAEGVREIYKSTTDHSATVGVGNQPLHAHRALVVGKNTGKNQTVVWGSDKEALYEEIKEKQQGIEECVEEAESGELAPSIKYKAEKARQHYLRLTGIGYDQKSALALVNATYKLGDSIRDIIVQRKKNQMMGKTPIEQMFRDGEEQYDQLIKGLENQGGGDVGGQQPMTPDPVMGQKVVTQQDIGRIAWVGPRFISIRWLKGNKLERIGRKRFESSLAKSHYVLMPKIRVAELVRKRARTKKKAGSCSSCEVLHTKLCACNYCPQCQSTESCPHGDSRNG
jgi:hypothetical protein